MLFPSIDQLPQLTGAETVDWYYPAYERRPYTSYFANQVIDLITTEEHFWRHLKYLRSRGEQGDIQVELLSHGALSLPRWDIEIAGKQFSSASDSSSFRVKLDTHALLLKDDDSTSLKFEGDWSSRLSDFGQLIHHLLPYIGSIQLVTTHDQLTFTIPK